MTEKAWELVKGLRANMGKGYGSWEALTKYELTLKSLLAETSELLKRNYTDEQEAICDLYNFIDGEELRYGA